MRLRAHLAFRPADLFAFTFLNLGPDVSLDDLEGKVAQGGIVDICPGEALFFSFIYVGFSKGDEQMRPVCQRCGASLVLLGSPRGTCLPS